MANIGKIAAIASGVLVLGVAAYAADRLILGTDNAVTTNDAYIDAYSSIIAPKISGRIDVVQAQDNEHVRTGDVLAHIEDDDYRAALTVARGDVAAAQGDIDNLKASLLRQDSIIKSAIAVVNSDQAALDFAHQDETRYRNLSAGGAGSVEQQQRTAAQTRQATAIMAKDQASLESAKQEISVISAELKRAEGTLVRAQGNRQRAELDLSYCTIRSPIDGVVGVRGVRVGNYVHEGTALMAVVPVHEAFVVAHFQETQLTHVRPGQAATVWVDTFPDQPLKAHVNSIPPATGVAFALIQPDNATGNFTKVVQRLPVRVTFDPNQPIAARVRVGMSVEVKIDTRSNPNGPSSRDERYGWN